MVKRLKRPQKEVKIAVVGKYIALPDAYKSILEALEHAGMSTNSKPNIIWINAEENAKNIVKKLEHIDAIIIHGGFGSRAIEGKIKAIQYARENNVPLLGICLGMQLSIIEACRNLLDIKDATSSEFSNEGTHVVGLMEEWEKGEKVEKRSSGGNLGGTMRLGLYPCDIRADTKAHEAYGEKHINERHRHRYEVDITYKEKLEKAGMIFSGLSPDKKLPEIIEYKNHPWFVAVQFHPEFSSKIFSPNALFVSLLKAAKSKRCSLEEIVSVVPKTHR